MLSSTACPVSSCLGRLAITALILTLSIATPVEATKGVKLITKYPTNQQECDEIFGKVIDAVMIETNGEGLAIQHFLIGTQADKVLAELCAAQNYAKAVDFANSIVDGDPQPPQVKNPNVGKDCFLNC